MDGGLHTQGYLPADGGRIQMEGRPLQAWGGVGHEVGPLQGSQGNQQGAGAWQEAQGGEVLALVVGLDYWKTWVRAGNHMLDHTPRTGVNLLTW